MEKKRNIKKNIRIRQFSNTLFLKYKTKGKGVTLILITLLLLVEFSPNFKDIQVSAISGSYNEDFSTTTYRDTSTNASGWGNGEINLPTKNIELVGFYEYRTQFYDWTPRDLFIDGDLAYITENTGLEIFNISNVRDPKPISECNLGGSLYTKEVVVIGDYAYVSWGYHGLVIFDVSDPYNPVNISSIAIPGLSIGLDVVGDYVYIVQKYVGDGGTFHILNVSDPYNPQNVSACTTLGYADKLTVVGNYAYVVDDWPGFNVINITDIRNPKQVHYVYGSGRDVEVRGNFAYVATGGIRTFVIYNISDPSTAYEISSIEDGAGSWSAIAIKIWGNYAFLIHRYGLRVVDISDPLNPTIANDFRKPFEEFNTGFDDMVISGDHVFFLDNYKFLAYELSDLIAPQIVSSYSDPNATTDVLVDGPYVFLCDLDGVKIIDNSNLFNHTLIGSVSTPNKALDIEVDGDYAYVANYLSGLQVINISNPIHPHIVGSYTIPADTENLVVVGNTIYLADHDNGLHIVNITNPTEPSFLGIFDTPGNAWDVYIAGDTAFVADYDAGLVIIDISDPKNPTLRSTYDTPGNAIGLVVDGEHVFIADTSGMQVVNITDIDNPSFAGEFYALGGATDIDISGNYAYLAANEYGIQIVNITDPRNPVSIDVCDTPGQATGVKREGEYVYVADYNEGLQIIEVAKHKYRQYEELAVAQSLPISTGPVNSSLIKATLSSSDNIPVDTSISYYLSADNGTTWEQVDNGVEHNFINSGYVLLWRSILTSSKVSLTASISSLSISYGSKINPPNLISPSHEELANNNLPIFEWETVSGSLNYNIQIATDPSFLTGVIINQTVGSTSYTPVSPVLDDIYYWRVAAIDLEGTGVFSSIYMLTIDSTIPNLSHPSDFSLFYGSSGYSIIWTIFDEHPDTYSILRNGALYESGSWNTSITTVLSPTLQVGNHNFTCICTDQAGNPSLDEVWITILPIPDSNPPIISHPSDMQFEEGSMGYEIIWTGSDDQSPWWASVTQNGTTIYDQAWLGNEIIITLDNLPLGTTMYNCTLFDERGNSIFDIVNITVQPQVPDTDPPLIVPPEFLEYEEGTEGHYLNWICHDDHPYAYRILFNDTEVVYAPWYGGNISICVDGLTIGLWYINLTTWDLKGNNNSAIMLLRVIPPLPDEKSPIVSQPAVQNIGEGTRGEIIWEVNDEHPANYKIFKNGSLIFLSSYWESGLIRYSYSSLSVGVWLFNLTVWDLSGNSASSIVMVVVVAMSELDTVAPEISQPPDQEFNLSSTGNSLQFHIFDEHPSYYIILLNNQQILITQWIMPNQQVNISLDELSTGLYTVNLTACDLYENFASRTVTVTVVGDITPPTIDSQPDVLISEEDDIEIIWEAFDLNPSHFVIILIIDGEVIANETWDGQSIVFTFSNLAVGSHDLRCIVYDTSGNLAFDDITITVTKSQSSPGFEIFNIVNLLLVYLSVIRAGKGRRRLKK